MTKSLKLTFHFYQTFPFTLVGPSSSSISIYFLKLVFFLWPLLSHRKVWSLVFLFLTKRLKKISFFCLHLILWSFPVESDLTFKCKRSKLSGTIWGTRGDSLFFSLSPSLLPSLCSLHPFPTSFFCICPDSYNFTIENKLAIICCLFCWSFKIDTLGKGKYIVINTSVSDFFMPRAAWAFWKEEGRLVEDKGSYRREAWKALNSEGRRDFLICCKLALLTAVWLRSLLTQPAD